MTRPIAASVAMGRHPRHIASDRYDCASRITSSGSGKGQQPPL
jgi:hypothetical protein